MDSRRDPRRPPVNAPIVDRPVLARQTRSPVTPTPQSRASSSRQPPPPQATQRPILAPSATTEPAYHRPPAAARRNQQAQTTPAPARTAFRPKTIRLPDGAVELKVIVKNIPSNWTTWKIYEILQQFGSIDRIDIHEPRRKIAIQASVYFSPLPPLRPLQDAKILLEAQSGAQRELKIVIPDQQEPHKYKSPVESERYFLELITVPIAQVEFGVMQAADALLIPPKPNAVRLMPAEMMLNLHRKALDIHFRVAVVHPQDQRDLDAQQISNRLFKMRFSFPQIRTLRELEYGNRERKAWALSMSQPPMVFRKTEHVERTHDGSASYWTDWHTWFRQTEIDVDLDISNQGMIQLQSQNAVVDIGRCLTYGLVFEEAVSESENFKTLIQALQDHSVPIQGGKIHLSSTPDEVLWNWLDNPTAVMNHSSPLSDLHEMASRALHLPFPVRYQLEVCISHGILHECNITKEFLTTLNRQNPDLIIKIMEKAVEVGERFLNPEEMIQRLLLKVSHIRKSIPFYCAIIRSATMTPTTIYFMTPIMETSNRVIRKYDKYEDHFLRVKFTDEKYKGKIHSTIDSSMNQVYTRIKRALTNGINVAGRRYDFLAFGNSQIREHGAWFFAAAGELTADKIRKDLGDFDHIKVVAKHASRIGQCFSTTKSTAWPVATENIPDINIEREVEGKIQKYCFTDGVGKISPFLAQMIAQQLGYPSSAKTCPSAFQFRHEGCKGILVVDPTLKTRGKTIQTRPSQIKFPGAYHHGLEIVRISQFSASYLNIQLILVLSALGVEDDVFVQKLEHMLAGLQEAVHNEHKALELLSKYVDYNHMTIQLARIILDGFMKVQDPFIISCLQLWRAWSLKYLKKKAKIFVEEGAFVLGCVDETSTLRGHYSTDRPDDHDVSKLPQIFLQIETQTKGEFKVIEGVCALMRNPSLHPGDIRVVLAVDVPALHHIRDCVVLPSTGDRDLANMCSGGDLDGDDYLVIWDEELIPKEWNHPPMDFEGATPREVDNVTVDLMTSFFVTHMKNDLVGPIAVAHRNWADAEPDGVKSDICLKLATQHSTAVDFAKTGQPAIMEPEWRVKRWPHWTEPKNKPPGKVYQSKRVIGQLYDAVVLKDFEGSWFLPFDKRILDAYELDDARLQLARELKGLYDESMRQVMAKYAIGNEFEVWTTFVMEHSDDFSDYKLAETMGEAAGALKEAHQKLCYEKAGTDEVKRDWSKLGPFVAAMYAVTAKEVGEAVEECKRTQMKGGELVPVKVPKFDNMPFMSFPWLFSDELGKIATSGYRGVKPRSLVEHEDLLWDDDEDFIFAEDDATIRQQTLLSLRTTSSSCQKDLLTAETPILQDSPKISPAPSLTLTTRSMSESPFEHSNVHADHDSAFASESVSPIPGGTLSDAEIAVSTSPLISTKAPS